MSRNRLISIAVMGCLFLTAAAQAAEETIHFREGGGSGYTDVTLDDTYIDEYSSSSTYGSNSNIDLDTSRDMPGPMAIKDLFTELPITSSGATIDIKSATLHLFRYNQGSSSDVVSLYPITSNWLPDTAGSNENDVCFDYAEKSGSTQWASGDWSTSDYDSTVCNTGNWVSNYNQECEIDVTDVIREIYADETNYGWVIYPDSYINFRSSEGSQSLRPSLEITYEYVGGTTYTLTVNSGTGDGSYSQGATPTITADTAPSGQEFNEWAGDTSGIANVNASSTTLTMPAANQEVTATYTDKTWTLTVNSGTGDGSYVVGTEIPISADTAPSGQEFDEWVGEISGVVNVNSAATMLTMPYADAEVTATYTDKKWTLTVNGGTGDGDYVVATVVDVTADAAPSGYAFDDWTGDVSGLADGEDPSTTYTMPYSNAEITATYINVYILTVNSGTGDGAYEAGSSVAISADEPPTNTQMFAKWIGDTSYVSDVSAADTTFGMPSSDAEITATYANIQWTLTVNSGTGDGTYDAGTVVDITADTAPSGYAFEEWIGDTDDVLDVLDPTTKVTMPIHDVTVTASYTQVYWTLTVNSGSGDGDYAVNTIVDITSDAAPSGSLFDKWTGDTSGIADVNDPSTTLTMPGGDAEITATYAEVVEGLVSRFTFDIDARDNYGTNDGTLTNGASVTQDATRGPVLVLDGDNDYVDLPAGNMAAGRSEVTLSLWVKPDSWAGSDTVYDEYAEAVYWQFSVTGSTFYTRDTSTGTMGSRDNDVSMPTIPTGEWHHLALVYSVSGEKKAVYYDGSLYASTSTSIETLTSDRGGARIGYACDGTYFDGLIDDVRLYSRALNTQEIAILAENPLYTLTVNSGSGDGDYVEDTVVDISADAPPSGQDFVKWIGDTSGIANVNASSTTLTMPAAAQEITATYTNKTWTLTVNSGSGDGSYVVGTEVPIAADTAPSGKQFDEWVGDVTGIANVNSASTTLTMPYADATITATYTDITYSLTVNSGTGDGDYAINTIVDIVADAAPSGYVFDRWTGDTSNIADVNASSTTITMPGSDTEITATYEGSVTTYTLTVNSGTGDGDYEESTVVDIDANTAPSGMLFDTWTGDTSNIAAINDPSTTLTMPAAHQEITATYADVVDGLVSRFTFDTDARDTYGTNHGTLTNGASVTSDATRGKVLSLDGDNDYASLPSSAMAAGRSELTLSLWVNPDTWAGGDTIYDEYAETNYWQFTILNGTFYTRDSSTGTTGSRDNDVSLPSLSTGSWQHLAFVYSTSGNTKAIYLDGVKQDSSSTSIDTLTSTRDGVGIGYACDGNHFDGKIDDVRLYSKALNLTQLALLAEKALYTLTVSSGTGDGEYCQAQVIDVSADAAPSGYTFEKWVGDTSGLADANSASTSITMPGSNAWITATYSPTGPATYTLTVNSGSGDGTYSESQVVDITADTAPSGQTFDEWVGDTGGIADVSDPSTTLTMPASNQEITAIYEPLYTLTVNSGTGDGDYVAGAVVNISADAPPSGKAFDQWVGDTADVANVNSANTTVTMPSGDVEVTATYEDIGPGPSVNSTSGTWAHGSSVTIYGVNFGSHADYQTSEDYLCLGWTDFEDGTVDSGPWYIVEGQYNSPNWAVVSTGGRSNSSYHAKKYMNVSRLGGLAVTQLANYDEWYSTFYIKIHNTGPGGKIFRIYGDVNEIAICTGGDNTYIRADGQLCDPQWSSEDEIGYDTWRRIEMWMDEDPEEYTTWMDFAWQWTRGSEWNIDPWGGQGHTWEVGNLADGDMEFHYDDIYFSPTRARVEIGNASTWAGCTAREIQIPTAWSNSTITIKANKGAFSSFSGKYLYVADSSGNVSAGYAL